MISYAEVVGTIAALGTVATALTVYVGLRHLQHVQEEATKTFEDELSREYRSIVSGLPAQAFFVDGRVDLVEPVLGTFYRYFDLSNEQLFHGRVGRVTGTTLDQWKDGIGGNLRLPVFADAWSLIAARIPGGFLEDLREVA